MRDQSNASPRRTAILATLLVLIFLAATATHLSRWYEQRLLLEQRARAQAELTPYGSSLAAAVDGRMALLGALMGYVEAEIRAGPDVPADEFQFVAEALHTSRSAICNLGIAPGGVYRLVYPPESEVLLLGYDMLHDDRPEVQADVRRAIENDSVALTGPHELREGGLGMVARQPVHRGEELWGLVAITLDVSALLQEAELSDGSGLLDICLVAADDLVLYGNGSILRLDPVVYRVPLPEGTWRLAAVPRGGWQSSAPSALPVFQLSLLIIVALLSALTYVVAGRQSRLARDVQQRTADLAQANASLQTELNERQRVEEELRQSKRYTQLIVDNLPLLFAYMSPDRRYVYVNRQYEEWFNAPVEAIIGRTTQELLTAELFEAAGPFVAQALAGQTVYWEAEATFPDGVRRSFRIQYVPHYGDDGQVQGYMSLMEDTRQRKRIESELLRAQKLESIGILAGGIAHDFNNLLTAILGNLSVARSEAERSGNTLVAETLDEAEKASLRARGLTMQLLTFAKGGRPVRAPFCLADLLRESTAFALRGSNVQCELEIAPDLWLVDADEGQVNQVLNNLVMNAAQAMPRGGAVVVSSENVTITSDSGFLQPGDYVRVSVSDRGIGIPPEHLNKVFDPYFTTKEKGSGLGLAAAYSIIKNHQGHIEVESTVGEGTVVTIYLPAMWEDTSVGVSPSADGADSGQQTASGHVLLMDDDEMVRDVGARLLRYVGYTVECAEDGQQAVEMYQRARERSQPFDVLVLDLTVPGRMGGLETIRILRDVDPTVRAIVSSGYSTDPIMAEYGRYGFVGVVPKPYQPEQLCGAVSRALATEPSG